MIKHAFDSGPLGPGRMGLIAQFMPSCRFSAEQNRRKSGISIHHRLFSAGGLIAMNEKRSIPTKGQLDFLDWEFGAFFHFGIRSFFPGSQDWDGTVMPASAFNPDQLDCNQWIETVKQAGARYAVLVCKHHDGFANWPSKYTRYSVTASPWKDGKGDVVQEFVDACRLHGLKVGLYYSPAQIDGEISYANGKEYDDYFIHQISELLSNYGKIDYLWFDGCGSEGHEYDQKRIINTIRSLQPDLLIFNMWDPDTRWIGNEDGYAPDPNYNIVSFLDFSVRTKEKDTLNNACFLPGECDFKMRSTWFDCMDNEDTIKEAEELLGIYELSVGRGSNFLINIGPNCHGLLPEKDKERILEFGELLRRRYASPLTCFSSPEQNDENQWYLQLVDNVKGPQLVNCVILMEDLRRGEVIEEFSLYAHLPGNNDQKICIYRGKTIGHKHICCFPVIRTGKLVLEITKANGNAFLREFKAFYSK